MKRFLVCLLTAATILSLTACGVKDAALNSVNDALSGGGETTSAQGTARAETTMSATAAEKTASTEVTAAPTAVKTAATAETTARKANTPTQDDDAQAVSEQSVQELVDATESISANAAAPVSGSVGGGTRGGVTLSDGRQIASVANPGGYWRGIEDEWSSAPEEGYVWTVTIDDTETVSMMGLVEVDYKMKRSGSHVGSDMLGAYSGEMSMEYAADMDALGELLTLTGGSMDYDADGWFKNANFLMRLEQFSQDSKDEWTDTYGKLPESEDPAAQALMEQYMGDIFDGAGSGDEEFETENSPGGHWFDWDFRMTEGDMSGYLQLTNIAYGTTTGGGTVDASGRHTAGSATVSAPFVGTISERYSEEIETPMPYTLEVYDAGQVVVTLYSANGGPVTVKFYGTIDKIPVEKTTVVKN
jgi:hypothetical protein